MKDAESVRNQQQQHLQQHSCTLDECFQLYTKEEQVRLAKATRQQSEQHRLLLSESQSEHLRFLQPFPAKRSGGIQKYKTRTAIYLVHHVCFPI